MPSKTYLSLYAVAHHNGLIAMIKLVHTKVLGRFSAWRSFFTFGAFYLQFPFLKANFL
jgi:hypothetical protein